MTIVKKNNQLQGSELAIRKFMYDLYFMLPLYPNVLKQRVESCDSFDQPTRSGHWSMDPIRLNQWRQLAQWRIDQGHCLQVKKGQEKVRERIVIALDEAITLPLPPQEKAALFLLSLNEGQFLNPLRQKEFIQQFSSEDDQPYLTNDFEEVNVCFFEAVISLMHQFFQLSLSRAKEDPNEGQIEEKQFLAQLIKNYYRTKERFEQSLVLIFQLTGSLALQEWIRKIVCHHLQMKGFYLLEDKTTHYNRQVIINNGGMSQKSANVGCLPTIPEEGEIKQALKRISL